MRKLILFNMVTLDGYFQGLERDDISWHNADNKEFNDFAIQQTGDFGILFFGRITYEGMSSFWPSEEALKSDPEVAKIMNEIPKVVISSSMEKADWENTTLIKDNVKEEIQKLKEQDGKDMAIFGSGKLAQSLSKMGLIDELRIMVNPIILGKGRPMFEGWDMTKLKLENTKVFESGNVLLYYTILK